MNDAHCKKCIHHDICESYSGLEIITFFPHNKDCKDFKPASVEVQHGEWIMHTNSDGNLNHYECSVCHRPQGYKSNYCEDCGSKMDKEESV